MNPEHLTDRPRAAAPHPDPSLELEHLQRTFSSIYAATPPRPDDLMYKALANRFKDVCAQLYSDMPAPDFRYLGTHAEETLTQPTSMAAAGEELVFVVEPKKNRVQILDGEFRQLRKVEGVFNFPTAALGRKDGSAWVCDWGNRRLVHLDRDGESRRTIDLNAIDSPELPQARPYAACRDGKTFFLLVNGNDPHQYSLVTFHEDRPAASLRRLDTIGAGRPIGVASGNGGLAIVSSLPPAVYGYDPETENFTSRQSVFLPGETRGITPLPTGFLVTAGKYVCVVGHDLELQSVLDLEQATGIEGSFSFTSCLRTRNGVSSVLLPDKRLGCIHEFGLNLSDPGEVR